MQHIKLRTEYNFGKSYGKIKDVIRTANTEYVGICDRGTWGYVKWQKACMEAGVKPIYAIEIPVVADAKNLNKKQNGSLMTFIAKNQQGIKDIYLLNTMAGKHFYYESRLDYELLKQHCTDNLFVLSGGQPLLDELRWMKNLYLEASPGNPSFNRRIIKEAEKYKLPIVAVCDNSYPTYDDKPCYEIINNWKKTTPEHIMDEWELRSEMQDLPDSAFENTDKICSEIDICQLPIANDLSVDKPETILSICSKELKKRGLETNEYVERLKREAEIIKAKNFEDYFYIVSNMVRKAKQKMLVGPGRGSSAGSLVCYLLGITDIDPIKYDLIFERFVDITRTDLPDIDIDFPDIKRQLVIDDLRETYGEDCVSHIGTVSKLKPNSAILDVGRAVNIPPWETKDFKESIIVRAPGDERQDKCIEDSFKTELGKEILTKYPALKQAAKMEGHSRHSGVHAAGLIVMNSPISDFCSVNHKQVAQIDKNDAEDLNILKLDALGLRTLSVLETCLEQIGMTKEELLEIPLDDKETFDLFNKGSFAGVFQFEGPTLQQITKEMSVESFDDIVALTTIARPGPLNSGGTKIFINRRTEKEETEYLHVSLKQFTKDTYGIIIFQEQVMKICRELGGLSWEDVTKVRKAMGKSQGKEAMNVYEKKFLVGAKKHMPEKIARNLWDQMCTFGAYAFNKSHAVSYATISYWCAYLKAHHPLEYAAACLQNNMVDDKIIFLLRELVNEGFEYIAFDAEKSMAQWTVQDGILVGALTGAHGCGEAMAASIIEKRKTGEAFLPSEKKLLEDPVVSYADVFEVKNKFGEYYTDPEKFNILYGEVSTIDKVEEEGNYIVIGKLIKKDLKDINDPSYLKKRNGRVLSGCSNFLQLRIQDDTGEISCMIGRFDYPKIGKKIMDEVNEGDFLLVKGDMKLPYRSINVKNVRLLRC